jgi:hypothetical protein
LPRSQPGDTKRDCGDEDCDHYPCEVYREGYEAGRADGYGAGRVDGFVEGYNAGQSAASRA